MERIGRMQRVVFIIEDTELQLGCMLNPESLVIRRRAGIQRRQSVGGLITGTEMADDPLLITNGGSTEIRLQLVFDVTLPGSSVTMTDVRDLTRPLCSLAENTHQAGIYKGPPLCRLVWGKMKIISGVITAVAERLEYFTASGVPRRSWLSLAMQRVEVESKNMVEDASQQLTTATGELLTEENALAKESNVAIREDITGDQSSLEVGMSSGERLEQLAQRYYGDVRHWRGLALHNNIDNPMDIPGGLRLEMPAILEY